MSGTVKSNTPQAGKGLENNNSETASKNYISLPVEEYSAILAESHRLKTEVEDLSNNQYDLQNENDKLCQQISDLKEERIQLKSDKVTAEENLENLRKLTDEKTSDTNPNLDILKKQKDEIAKEKLELQLKIEELNGNDSENTKTSEAQQGPNVLNESATDFVKLKEDIIELKSENESLKKHLDNLSQGNKELVKSKENIIKLENSVENLENEKDNLEKLLTDYDKKCSELKEENVETEKELKQKKDFIELQDKEMELQKGKLERLQKEKDKLNNIISNMVEKNTKLNGDMDTKSKEVNYLEAENAKRQEKVNSLLKENKTLKKQAAKVTEFDKLVADISKLQDENILLKKQIEEMKLGENERNQLQEMEDKLIKLKRDNQKLTENAQHFDKMVNKLRDENTNLQRLYDDIVNEHEESKLNEENIKEERDAYESELQEINEKSNKLMDKIAEMEKNTETVHKEKEKLKEKHDKEKEKLQQKLDEKRTKYDSLMNDLNAMKKKVHSLNDENSVLIESLQEARKENTKLIEQLKKKNDENEQLSLNVQMNQEKIKILEDELCVQRQKHQRDTEFLQKEGLKLRKFMDTKEKKNFALSRAIMANDSIIGERVKEIQRLQEYLLREQKKNALIQKNHNDQERQLFMVIDNMNRAYFTMETKLNKANEISKKIRDIYGNYGKLNDDLQVDTKMPESESDKSLEEAIILAHEHLMKENKRLRKILAQDDGLKPTTKEILKLQEKLDDSSEKTNKLQERITKLEGMLDDIFRGNKYKIILQNDPKLRVLKTLSNIPEDSELLLSTIISRKTPTRLNSISGSQIISPIPDRKFSGDPLRLSLPSPTMTSQSSVIDLPPSAKSSNQWSGPGYGEMHVKRRQLSKGKFNK